MKTSIFIQKINSLMCLSAACLLSILVLSSCNSEDPVSSPNMEDVSAVAYSSDNGTSWKIQYVSEDLHSNSMISVTSMDFGTSLTAITYNSVYRSLDSGLSWTSLSPAWFYPKITGTGLTNSGIMIGYEGTILYTVDNGANFSPLVSGTNNYLTDAEIDASSGTGYVSGNQIILKTTDHGQSWFQPSGFDSVMSSINFTSLSLTNADKIQLTGYDDNWYPKLIKSNDGFQSYIILEFPYRGHHINSISFFDENTAVTIVDLYQGGLARSSAGGQFWTKIDFFNNTQIYAVKFVNGVCIATTEGRVYVSNDLGQTWNTHQFDGTYNFVDIYSPSPNNIFLSGYIMKQAP